jgi:hypothetical protein
MTKEQAAQRAANMTTVKLAQNATEPRFRMTNAEAFEHTELARRLLEFLKS